MLESGEQELPFEGRTRQASPAQQQASWQAIASRMHGAPVVAISSRRKWLVSVAVAASFVVMAVFAWQQWGAESRDWKTYSTAFGQTQRIVLPDQSVVVLNGNSSLKVPVRWNNDSSRTVWLKGEGYFEVTKSQVPGMAQFIVNTPCLQIRVLGTKFNVNAYNAEPVVALKEGRVEIIYTEKPEVKPVIIAPGQVVKVLTEQKEQPVVVSDEPEEIIADWIENGYHFNSTPLSDIAELIHNRFGYTMIFEDASLESRTMDGHLTAASLDELLTAIQVTLSINIEKKNGKQLVVKP